MDISRRRALGLIGLGGGVGLTSCASGASSGFSRSDLERYISTVPVSFDHGVASGDAMADRIIFWTRVTPAEPTTTPIPVFVQYSKRLEAFDELAEARIDMNDPFASTQNIDIVQDLTSTSASRDYTVKVDATGLEPDTVYFYRFAVMTGTGVVNSPIARTRTMPATGGDQLRAAVVSCSNWPFGYFNVYKAIAERDDVDAVIHLGDYFYEYGIDGYGGTAGEALGRRHDPVTEIVTLEDYRTRHAQYKTDVDLQAAHAIAPWFCTWDDHESTNNSYRSGAQNHNPENNEGDWTERKQRAVQAYLEWMPVRDPEPGRAREAIYRKTDFGDLATIFMLESRLTGRSDEISWFNEISANTPPAEVPGIAADVMNRVSDPSRTMLGGLQETWLADGMKASVEGGKTWQLLANQVILATVKLPNLPVVLTPEEIAAMPAGYGQMLMGFSPLGLPFNLDAWDGFPAARQRLYDAAQAAGANLITITGDTHTAWANELNDGDDMVGVEFGCTSVTSPGMGSSFPIERLGELYADANEDVVWYDPFGHGFTLLTLTPERAVADYYKVSTIREREFTTDKVISFETVLEDGEMSTLRQIS
ncbi:alkaline phosphatase D family protein [Ponticaulis sp.]|uniref:alkaline phosphatase D family protein n=1 Tax=Ponticaulis sp. TaxID=2020902 RepID=UPI000B66DBC0|nr:alkaline phosphatase D family protein [Ponticaulis sp.]MAI90082.1 alkaline phosphatase [Ponticaulis sp.]OUX99738.1 MAG: alkaline phosphatase [Hyphomonadaceae bacterium TMED5]|tara:strand:+ start:40339 stop:42114 length:1776 start_codon:yes stop_codon:yes gene_type:complete